MANIDEAERAEADEPVTRAKPCSGMTADVTIPCRPGRKARRPWLKPCKSGPESFSVFSELARRSTAQTMQLEGQPDGIHRDDGGSCTQPARRGPIWHRSGARLARRVAGHVERSQQRVQRNFVGLQAPSN